MCHFKRRNIFDVPCKLRSARQRNNIEKLCRRFLVKDLIKIAKFPIPLLFSREILVLTLGKDFLWKFLL